MLNISGDAGKALAGGALTNAGTINWTGSGNIVGSSATIRNLPGGVFNALNDASFVWAPSGTPSFLNGGLFRKSGSTGTSSFGSQWAFNNSGTVEVQSGTLILDNGYPQTVGSTILDGGSLGAGSTIYVSGGGLSGNGVVSAAVVNAAEVSPGGSPGTLPIVGSYTQTPAGRLTIEIGGLSPGSQHDRLVVNGPATLAGTLSVTLLNGFAPGLSNAFSVLNCGSRSGNFASVVQPGLPTGLALTPEYGPSALTLLVANLIGGVQTNAFSLAPGPGILELRFPLGPLGLYRFQASSNLVDWVDLSTNTPPGEVFRFVDLEASGLDHRFYRAERLP